MHDLPKSRCWSVRSLHAWLHNLQKTTAQLRATVLDICKFKECNVFAHAQWHLFTRCSPIEACSVSLFRESEASQAAPSSPPAQPPPPLHPPPIAPPAANKSCGSVIQDPRIVNWILFNNYHTLANQGCPFIYNIHKSGSSCCIISGGSNISQTERQIARGGGGQHQLCPSSACASVVLWLCACSGELTIWDIFNFCVLYKVELSDKYYGVHFQSNLFSKYQPL